jgi:hypothetical protein
MEAEMKSLIRTAAVAVAAVGISNITPTSLHVGQITEDTAGASQGRASYGLSFEDLRVGPTGKVPVEVGKLPVRVVQNKPTNSSGC